MKAVKCEKYDREFFHDEAIEYPGKVHVPKGKVMCADCLIDMGVSLDETDPYMTYIKNRTDLETGI